MRVLLLPLCCLLAIVSFAQTSATDSLEQRFSEEKDAAKRLELLSQMTNLAFGADFKAALGYAKRGMALSKQTGDKNWQPKFYEMTGRMHANLLHLDSANLFFDKATSAYRAVGNRRGEATTAFKIAWVHKRKGEMKEAMAADLQALRIMEELGDQEGIANALGRVAEDLGLQGRQQEALEYARRSIDICQKNGFQQELPYALRHAGDAYIAMGDNSRALEHYDQALKIIRMVDSQPSSMADIINCRGNALKRLGRYAEALEDYKVCMAESQQANYPGGVFTATANLGEVNLLMGNYKEALPYQLKTVQMQEQGGDMVNLVENYVHTSTIYEHLGDYRQALQYQKKARLLRDSLSSVASDEAISKLRTEYEIEKKEATIATQESRLAQQRTVQWLGFGIAALLALMAISFYRNARARKKANTLLTAKNAENELLLKEIHHRVKNNLEVVSSLLALQSAQIDDPNVKDAMQEGQNRVQSIGIVHQKLYQRDNLAAIEMKDYFLNLSESVLDSFGADDRVQIECSMSQLELDIDTAVPLGLIVNELLTNALKYAFPEGRKGKIQIKLERKNEHALHLQIADDGVGKASAAPRGTGFGTQLVELLTRQLNGSMRKDTRHGTAVSFDFVRA
ncbi:MAG TPA: tetratricopeptide repeat protein [Saprospiraceae bacterium]|nr:tetratricopeptide repeat protein [Saprospiraceae bacterium]